MRTAIVVVVLVVVGITARAGERIAWNTRSLPLEWTGLLAMFPDGELIASSDAGSKLYTSADGGTSWRWKSNSMPTKRHEALYAVDSSTVYCVTSYPQVFWKSVDRGITWDSIPMSLPSFVSDAEAARVHLDARGVFWLKTNGHLLWSSDEGRHWTRVPIPNSLQGTFALDAQGRPYVWSLGRLYQLQSDFLHWEQISPDSLSSFCLAPNGGIVVSRRDCVLRSMDGGRRWDTIAVGKADVRVHCCSDSNTVMVSYAMEQLCSRKVEPLFAVSLVVCKNGQWRELECSGISGASMRPTAIAVVGTAWIGQLITGYKFGEPARALYNGMRTGVLVVSSDSGRHWRTTLHTNADVACMAIDDNGKLSLGFDKLGGVVVSDDGGITWRERNKGLHVLQGVASLEIDKQNNTYACTPSAVYRTRAGWDEWECIYAVDSCAQRLGLCGTWENNLYLATSSADNVPMFVRCSADSGITRVDTWMVDKMFTSVSTVDGRVFFGIVRDTAHYVRTYALRRSDDSGRHWSAVRFLPCKSDTLRQVHLCRNGTLLAVVQGCSSDIPRTVWCSADSGTTWRYVEALCGLRIHALCATRDGVLWAVGSSLYKSMDNGNTWIHVCGIEMGRYPYPYTTVATAPTGYVYSARSRQIRVMKNRFAWERVGDRFSRGNQRAGYIYFGNTSIVSAPNGVFSLWTSREPRTLAVSATNGLSWEETVLAANEMPYAGAARVLCALPDSGLLVAQQKNAIAFFHKGELSPWGAGLPNRYLPQAVRILPSGDAVAGFYAHGLYATRDTGKTWACILPKKDIYDVVVRGQTVYAAAGDRLYVVKVTPGARNRWQIRERKLPDTIRATRLAVTADDVVIVGEWEADGIGCLGVLYRSFNQGRTWKKVNPPIRTDDSAPLYIRTIETLNGALAAGTTNGLWLLRNTSASWEFVGLAGEQVDAIAANAEWILAGTAHSLLRMPCAAIEMTEKKTR